MVVSKLFHTIFMRRILALFLSAFSIAIIFFLYLTYSEFGEIVWLPASSYLLLIAVIASFFIGFVLDKANQLLNRWIAWREQAAFRWITGFFVSITIAAIGIMTTGIICLYIQEGTIDIPIGWDLYHGLFIKICILTTMAILIYNVIYFALVSYNEYASVHIDAIKTKRKHLKLQFQALKSQLSPHYLFNCLNTISSLAYKDPALAEDFIRRLAQTYQYILSNNDKQLVSLDEEVDFVQSYNYLLQVRFQNNLKLSINLPPNVMKSKIPPLTLQLLVENAVKHNIISNTSPLSIYISAIDNMDLRIINTKTRAPADIHSFNVGLDNIKKRYRFFTDRKIRIDNSDKFCVQLPVISHQLSKPS